MNIPFFPALETIDFQKGSPLAVELTNTFQEVIDHREKFTKASERIAESVKFFNDVAINKIKAITKKYTGMEMKRVTVSKSFDMEFATCMYFGDQLSLNAHSFIEAYCGNADEAEYVRYMLDKQGMRVTTYEELMRVTNSLNTHTGFVENTKLDKKYKCGIELLFDPYSAFCAKEIISANIEYFSARELAAIVAHELGHTISMIEYAKYTYFAMKIAKQALLEFNKNASDDEKKKLLKQMIELEDKEQAQKINDIEYKKDPKLGSMFNVLYNYAYTLKLFWLPFRVLGYFIKSMFVGDYRNTTLSNREDKSGGANSDFRQSEKNLVYCEQLADQYAVRQGLGSALITSFQKMNDWFCKYKSCANPNNPKIWNSNKIPWFVSKLLGKGIIKYTRKEQALYCHELDTVRYESIMREQLQVFKQDNMSKEALDFYIRDYEASCKVINDKEGSEYTEQSIRAFYGLIAYIASTPREMLTTARFQAEYNKLVENVNKLMNNNLYFRKAKLEQLLLKSK